jgi:hypothetical protein
MASTYQCKTRDVYEVQQYTGPGYGWECVTAEETSGEAVKRLREYRREQPQYPARLVKTRERISQ